MILLLDALCCIWRPCNGETMTQDSGEPASCAVLCVVGAHSQVGSMKISKGLDGRSHRTCVMDLAKQAPSQESPSLLHSPLYSMYSADIHVSTKTIHPCTKNRHVLPEDDTATHLTFTQDLLFDRDFIQFCWGVSDRARSQPWLVGSFINIFSLVNSLITPSPSL